MKEIIDKKLCRFCDFGDKKHDGSCILKGCKFESEVKTNGI